MIRLSKSTISQAEKEAVKRVLDGEYFGMGKEVHQFESMLTDYMGRPTACVVNGTAALHLACQAVGLGQGDEVLVQSLTYLASFQAISATGATPVACDIEPATMTLNWRDAEKRLTENTKAVMPVHYGGGVGDLDEIYAFANQNSLRVIEDAAHAFGTHYKDNLVGSFGDVVCFSFDGIKNITSGEGGCVVTDDEVVLERIKDGRLLGIQKDSDKRYKNERSWQFDVGEQGWRYHMSDIMAAIGIEQLKKFPKAIKKRQRLAMQYERRLLNEKRITRLTNDYSLIVPHIYPVLLPEDSNKEEIRTAMSQEGIQTGIHYQPNHVLSFYQQRNILPLIQTENIFSRLLTLPLHLNLTLKDVDDICASLISNIEKNI